MARRISWRCLQNSILVRLIVDREHLTTSIWRASVWCVVVLAVRSQSSWQGRVWNTITRISHRVCVTNARQITIWRCKTNRIICRTSCRGQNNPGTDWPISGILNLRRLILWHIAYCEHLCWTIRVWCISCRIIHCIGWHCCWQITVLWTIWSLHNIRVTLSGQRSISVWQCQRRIGVSIWGS